MVHRTIRIAGQRDIDGYSDDMTTSCRSVIQDFESPNFGRHEVQEMCKLCDHCGASYYKDEGTTFCCSNGNVILPSFPEMPEELFNLWENSAEFRKNIRKYNQVMSFCSLGAKVDRSLANEERGVYTFRVNGQIHHEIGSAQPSEGEEGKFAQIYFFDNETQRERRTEIFPDLRPTTVDALQNLISRVNPYCHLYQQAHQVGVDRDYRIVFKRNPSEGQHPGRYNPPTVAEVGCIVLDTGDEDEYKRDIVIQKQGGGLQRISEQHAAYDPLMYTLLLPYGSSGWHDSITHYRDTRRVTLKDFAKYHLMVRRIQDHPKRNPLHLGGRLFQQWVVDQYAKIETNNLRYIRLNQKELRTDSYRNVTDAIANGDERIGRRIVLPSSFIGSDRHMTQCYQDSMALVRSFGKADYFITMTCNPKWPEIKRELLPGQSPSDRPDVVARVFNLKLQEFIKDIGTRHVLGRGVAHLHVIEFQKRGLPHAHVLLWVDNNDKPRSTDDFDKYVYAELPDPETQPILFKSVVTHMLHGPCGPGRNCACYDHENNVCKKRYPKQFCETTESNDDGYPLYRRRNNGRIASKRTASGNFDFDNRWVVPYNPYLLTKYDCHINVEICSSVQSVKYIHKYVHKGGDRANIRVVNGENVVDEIDDFVDGRYISPVEACWRIFGFKLHGQSHTVIRLPVHLEDNQPMYFMDDTPGPHVEAPVSKLVAFFQTCQIDPYARTLTYVEFPLHYCWVATQKCWKRRTRSRPKTIARMYTVSIREGERFFLRLLLTRVVGPLSFRHLRTYNGTEYSTFKEACAARGMLEDDTIWRNSLQECAQVATASQLREFFVSLLSFSFPVNAGALWETFKDAMGDDFRYRYQQATIDQIYKHTGTTICDMLREYGLSWDTYPGLPPLPEVDDILEAINHPNILIANEQNYPTNLDQTQNDISSLNQEQRQIFNIVTEAVNMVDTPELDINLFFLEGCGGTGKTFLNKTLLDFVRGSGKIALAVASSGIASLLLPGGSTAHSRFKIPLELTRDSSCNIRVNSKVGELLRASKFILWDEAPMVHRHAFEAVDRTLKDVCNSNKPMGGKVCLFSGDWRQILPVVLNGSKGQTVNSSLTRSHLWHHVRTLRLNQNMRVDANEIHFVQWLLHVGNGTHDSYPKLQFEQDNLVLGSTEELIETTYPNFELNYANENYIKDRVILATTNKAVDEINDLMSCQLDDCQTYHSIDSVDSEGDVDVTALYATEFLNSLSVNGLPPHELKLAVGSVVMLLRNLNKSLGLCNGTRLIVQRLFPNSIEAKIITGANIGRSVFIPRIKLSPSSSTLPFKLTRIQFPVKLAYAMTINKSQGQTFGRVGLSLLSPAFSHGQLYVALSRVRQREHLKILLPPGENTTINIVYKEALLR